MACSPAGCKGPHLAASRRPAGVRAAARRHQTPSKPVAIRKARQAGRQDPSACGARRTASPSARRAAPRLPRGPSHPGRQADEKPERPRLGPGAPVRELSSAREWAACNAAVKPVPTRRRSGNAAAVHSPATAGQHPARSDARIGSAGIRPGQMSAPPALARPVKPGGAGRAAALAFRPSVRRPASSFLR